MDEEQHLESLSNEVFSVSGEPATVLNGLPNITAIDICNGHSNVTSDGESKISHCYGKWMISLEVRKQFGDRYYSGTVVGFDQDMNWYRVVYEDGDFEDLDWRELQDVLLPLDITIPLKDLAVRTLKKKPSASRLRKERANVKHQHLDHSAVKEKFIEAPAQLVKSGRKRGRPRKTEVDAQLLQAGRKRGRPKKTEVGIQVLKSWRKRGRPRKTEVGLLEWKEIGNERHDETQVEHVSEVDGKAES